MDSKPGKRAEQTGLLLLRRSGFSSAHSSSYLNAYTYPRGGFNISLLQLLDYIVILNKPLCQIVKHIHTTHHNPQINANKPKNATLKNTSLPNPSVASSASAHQIPKKKEYRQNKRQITQKQPNPKRNKNHNSNTTNPKKNTKTLPATPQRNPTARATIMKHFRACFR